MANIANITLAILLAAQMAGANTTRQGQFGVKAANAITCNIN